MTLSQERKTWERKSIEEGTKGEGPGAQRSSERTPQHGDKEREAKFLHENKNVGSAGRQYTELHGNKEKAGGHTEDREKIDTMLRRVVQRRGEEEFTAKGVGSEGKGKKSTTGKKKNPKTESCLNHHAGLEEEL